MKEIEVPVKKLKIHDSFNFKEDGIREYVDPGKTTGFEIESWQGAQEKSLPLKVASEACAESDKGRYQKSTLENGVRVVTESKPGLRSVSIGILVDTGPRDETPDKSGLAHLVEHLMFCGTSSRSATQIARLMDEAGGNMGAFTARDYTCYSATVLDDYFTYALDLLGDLLLNSIFPPESLESEKNAILREIDSTRDMPAEQAHSLLKAYAWPDHPLGRCITGRPETVKSLTREDVIFFVHEHYLPDRIIVAAAGNVNHQDFVAQVRDAFWRLIGQSRPTSEHLPKYQSGTIIDPKPVSQAYFSLGIQTLPYADPNRYGLHVLNNILGGGISSRLFRRIRDKRGLVYYIGSEYYAYRDDGMLVVEGCTAPENTLQVLGMVLSEVRKLFSGEEPVDEEELWKAKMHIRGQHLISGEISNTRMNRLATQELYFGRRIPDEDILAQIDALETPMLQRLADSVLREALGRATIAVVGPEAPDHYQSSSIERLLSDYH